MNFPLIEVPAVLVPDAVTGLWIAYFRFLYGRMDETWYIGLCPLDEPIMKAQEVMATGTPRRKARLMFLGEISMSVQH